MHIACRPAYTGSAQGLIGVGWLWAAAFASTLEADAPLTSPLPGFDVSPAAVQHVLLAVGCASVLRTLVTRVPLCHF